MSRDKNNQVSVSLVVTCELSEGDETYKVLQHTQVMMMGREDIEKFTSGNFTLQIEGEIYKPAITLTRQTQELRAASKSLEKKVEVGVIAIEYQDVPAHLVPNIKSSLDDYHTAISRHMDWNKLSNVCYQINVSEPQDRAWSIWPFLRKGLKLA